MRIITRGVPIWLGTASSSRIVMTAGDRLPTAKVQNSALVSAPGWIADPVSDKRLPWSASADYLCVGANRRQNLVTGMRRQGGRVGNRPEYSDGIFGENTCAVMLCSGKIHVM